MVLAVITARMQSTRLPNKVLADIGGLPCLDLILSRLRNSRKINEIVLATPPSGQTELYAWSRRRGIQMCVGSTEDVLLRIKDVAMLRKADKVVRITGDLPFLSYEGVDAMIEALTPDLDYVNNVYGPKRWLDGTQAEVAWLDAVMRADRMTPHAEAYQIHPHITIDGPWRLHGFHWMANSPAFKQKFLECPHDSSDIPFQFMLDGPKDLEVARFLADKLHDDSYTTFLRTVRKNLEKIGAILAS